MPVALLRNDALRNNPILRRFPTNERAYRLWIQELNRQSVSVESVSASTLWTTTTVFSSSDADTVAWASGSLILANGSTYSIGAGNTGNMAARTYIYFDAGTSTTAYQTSTTATDAIGEDKLLIGVAYNTSTEAFFQVFGGIGGVFISANEIAANSITANRLAANLAFTNSLVLSSGGEIRQGQTAYDTGTGFWLGDDAATPKFSIGNSAGNKLTWNGSTLTVEGTVGGTVDAADLSGNVALSATNIAAQGWTTTTVFSSTDADTVAWATGTLTTAAGTSYSITGSNTGNMAARTYIYLDIGVSTTAFQTTTTAATAVGSGKILVAVAQNVAGEEAFFQVFGGTGGQQVTSNELAANAVTANAIVAATITAAKLAATLTFTNTLQLNSTGKIQAGSKTSASDSDSGLYMGTDGSSGWDLNIGDPTNYLHWDDSLNTLVVGGDLFNVNAYGSSTSEGDAFATDTLAVLTTSGTIGTYELMATAENLLFAGVIGMHIEYTWNTGTFGGGGVLGKIKIERIDIDNTRTIVWSDESFDETFVNEANVGNITVYPGSYFEVHMAPASRNGSTTDHTQLWEWRFLSTTPALVTWTDET